MSTSNAPTVDVNEPAPKRRRKNAKKKANEPVANAVAEPLVEPPAAVTDKSGSEDDGPATALVIKNKITQLIKSLECSMSHDAKRGTVSSLTHIVDMATTLACASARARNKKAARPQVTVRDFGPVIEMLQSAINSSSSASM